MAPVKAVCNLQNCRQLRDLQVSIFIQIDILSDQIIIAKIHMIILDRIGHDFPLKMRKTDDLG